MIEFVILLGNKFFVAYLYMQCDLAILRRHDFKGNSQWTKVRFIVSITFTLHLLEHILEFTSLQKKPSLVVNRIVDNRYLCM